MTWSTISSLFRTLLIVGGVGMAARWTDAVIRCRELFNSDPWGLASESAVVCLSDELEYAKMALLIAAAPGLVWGIMRLLRALRTRSPLAPPAGTFILRD